MSQKSPSPENLFFPSPPPPTGFRVPEGEISVLVHKAQTVKSLSSAVSQFLDHHKFMFVEVLNRQIQLIKSRSQSLDDGQVTIYDKALLLLTHNGNELESPAAIHFYCEKFLGLNLDGKVSEVTKSLQASVKVPQLLDEGSALSETTTATEKRPAKRDSFPRSHRKDMEPKLARLWRVYETARADYLAVVDKDSQETISTAKFLRDTAENTLQYLKNKNVDPIMVTELEATYNMAKAEVVSLTGGKKRKFDLVEIDDVKGVPRGPSNETKTPRRGEPKQPYLSRSTDIASGHRESRSSHGSSYGARDLDTSIARFTEDPGFQRGYGDPLTDRGSSRARGRGSGMAPTSMRGRGHSGTPCRYSRGVDSWKPYGDRRPRGMYG
ncbi:uncharacterized protein Z518_05186 [Rhinocladiella mackenziei CBS 650.93]|uniref:Uncharacterized protein n=1 Tax=Rhinocladiella mackenziei CBS 650.93 TaxID=1442369 RepID=A0A0D2IES4_9EURO|nr:uncharacterized protein Z518_05186 [Rhinocladiella mackenziei CBS 650.93]KIX04319.1 hypothetical protein Z518_05186 [Rhinocladiella mackenziei CBS 650.93]